MGVVAPDFTILPVSQFNQTLLKTIRSTKKYKKILIIEDDPDMSLVLGRSLKENYNCLIDIANDPFEAINFIVEKFYDLIILDWQLPGLNGAETLVEAEKCLRLEPSIPIQWDRGQAPVVVFSATEKKYCPPRKTKHFNYIGYISKAQPLNDIIKIFGAHIGENKKIPAVNPVVNPVLKFS